MAANETEKNQILQLEKYVYEYKLFIDTCSLMMGKITDLFWQHIIPLLKKTGKKIFLPYKCWLELKKHAANTSGVDVSPKALKAMDDIRRYQEEGYVSIKSDNWEKEGAFADNTIKTVFTMYRDRYAMLLITQDNNLAKEIIGMNDSKAVSGKRVQAKKINRSGYLSSYEWEEGDFAGKEEGSSSASDQSSAFKLYTKVSDISCDPIILSYVPKENDVVYCKKGKVRLCSQIADGGEGVVYETDTPYVAKIYKEGKLTQQKREKLRRMVSRKLDCEGICFPVEELYNSNKEVVGFLMQRANGTELQRSIFIKPLFLEKFPGWKKKELVQLCITILEKILYLHKRNIIMGDINAGNILVVSPKKVCFVDTDSYQIEDLPCPVGVPVFTPPELQGKPYKTFLRSYGNEYFAVATLLFMLMLTGKAPYAQQGGEDAVTNIKNMDFSYPCGDKSNKKTPNGQWGFIWSHLSFKLKEAFYNTFSKEGTFSTESTRLPVAKWIKLFNQYYYELTDGNMLKNDAMSGELFPTRLKKNPNTEYIICKSCGREVDEKFTQNGICKDCQRLQEEKSQRNGKEDFSNEDRSGIKTNKATIKKDPEKKDEKSRNSQKNDKRQGKNSETEKKESQNKKLKQTRPETRESGEKTNRKKDSQIKTAKKRSSAEEKLKKKKICAIATVERLCQEQIDSISGFHPLIKIKLKKGFKMLIDKITASNDIKEIGACVSVAKEIDINDYI